MVSRFGGRRKDDLKYRQGSSGKIKASLGTTLCDVGHGSSPPQFPYLQSRMEMLALQGFRDKARY